MISFTSWSLFLLGKIPDTQSIGEWVVLGEALDDLENQKNFLPFPEIEKLFFGCPARTLVTLPATTTIHKLCAAAPRDISKRGFFFQFMFFILLSNGYYVISTNNYEVFFLLKCLINRKC